MFLFVRSTSFSWIEQKPISCAETSSPPFTIDVIGKQKNVVRRPSASVCLAACPTSFLYFLCSLTEDKSANLGEQGVLKSKCVCPAVIESLGQDSYKFKQVKG